MIEKIHVTKNIVIEQIDPVDAYFYKKHTLSQINVISLPDLRAKTIKQINKKKKQKVVFLGQFESGVCTQITLQKSVETSEICLEVNS